MAAPKQLEIEDDAQWQFAEWRVHRVLWVLGALVLLAALLGLLGSGGPFANGRTESSDLALRYERFGRRESTSELTVEIGQPAERIDLHLGSAFVDKARIERVSPEPDSTSLTGDGYILSFTAEPGALTEIRIEYTPDSSGSLPLEIGVAGQSVDAVSFVYP